MIDEIRLRLLERASSGVDQDRLVTADELAVWPNGALTDLVADGTLREIQPVSSIECDGCYEGHVEPVQVVQEPPGSPLRHYIACPEVGRVEVDPERMRRWRIRGSRRRAGQEPDGGAVHEDVPRFRHSEDYTYVALDDLEFRLSDRQGSVVRMLDSAGRAGAPDLQWSQIAKRLGKDTPYEYRMHDVFKGVPDWRKLIVSKKRGFYRLNV